MMQASPLQPEEEGTCCAHACLLPLAAVTPVAQGALGAVFGSGIFCAERFLIISRALPLLFSALNRMVVTCMKRATVLEREEQGACFVLRRLLPHFRVTSVARRAPGVVSGSGF